ncbi:hypothetical protein TRIUR3_30244 [Triticum urartu]|uniref:Uncharacterized protein n=1 Tax=Triticum urartu TaxID=4572 RepID=M7Y9J3_TRIUA|nr:hypothetical protein TRIUR3_30244 [Triticum urartu]
MYLRYRHVDLDISHLLFIVLLRTLNGLSRPPHSLANQVVVIREKLAEPYEFEQQWSRAVQMLSGIDLDSGIRMLDDKQIIQVRPDCMTIWRMMMQ